MIEIALSLAVIGFALVAIVGILPLGMNVQKENRQETIINQDASMFMDAIRSGALGPDDLTNYVMAITNYARLYNLRGNPNPNLRIFGYTTTNSTVDGSASTPQVPLTSGFRIIGLLSTPKITPLPTGGFWSNHVVAFVRSLSGPASEKYPQNNADVQSLALNYKMIVDVSSWTNFNTYPSNTLAWTNFQIFSKNMQTNLHEVRLTFRWPLVPSGDTGPGRQVFRTEVSGLIVSDTTNVLPGSIDKFYFFEPRNFLQVTNVAQN